MIDNETEYIRRQGTINMETHDRKSGEGRDRALTGLGWWAATGIAIGRVQRAVGIKIHITLKLIQGN